MSERAQAPRGGGSEEDIDDLVGYFVEDMAYHGKSERTRSASNVGIVGMGCCTSDIVLPPANQARSAYACPPGILASRAAST